MVSARFAVLLSTTILATGCRVLLGLDDYAPQSTTNDAAVDQGLPPDLGAYLTITPDHALLSGGGKVLLQSDLALDAPMLAVSFGGNVAACDSTAPGLVCTVPAGGLSPTTVDVTVSAKDQMRQTRFQYFAATATFGTPQTTVSHPGYPTELRTWGGQLAVVVDSAVVGDAALFRVDPKMLSKADTGTNLKHLHMGPSGVIAGNLWVASRTDGVVVSVDPGSSVNDVATLSSGAVAFAVGDANGDTIADGVILTGDSATWVVLGDSSHSAHAVTSGILATPSPHGIAVGDFQAKGRLDLVAATNNGTYVSRVFYAPNLGSGASVATEVFSDAALTGFADLRTTVSADFNGDGYLDLAIGTVFGSAPSLGTVMLLFGDGHGAFSAPAYLPAGGFTPDLVTADFNGDGLADLAAVLQDKNTIAVWFGTGGPAGSHGVAGLGERVPISSPSLAGAAFLTTVDADGNSLSDLAFLASPTTGSWLAGVILNHTP